MLNMGKKYGRYSNREQKRLQNTQLTNFMNHLHIRHHGNERFTWPRAWICPPAWTATHRFLGRIWILKCMKIWNGDLHEKKRSTAWWCVVPTWGLYAMDSWCIWCIGLQARPTLSYFNKICIYFFSHICIKTPYSTIE